MLASVSSLLFGVSLLLLGNGLLGTVLGIRAAANGFSALATGILMSAYFAGYVWGGMLCPRIIRRVGHIRTFAALGALFAATAIAYGLVVDPVAWTVMRLLSGIALVGLYMVIESWLNVAASNENRGRIFSTYTGISLLAMAVAQFLILVDTDPMAPFALATLFIALAVIPVALTRTLQPQSLEAPAFDFRMLYEASPLGVAGTAVTGLTSGAFWGMAAVFAQRIGLTHLDIAIFMSASIVGGALLQRPIGWFSDRFDRRGVLIGVCIAAIALALGVWSSVNWFRPALYVSAFLYGGLAFSTYSLAVAHTNDHVSPEQVLDATRGLLIVYGVGAAIGPSLAGIAMAIGGPSSLYLYFAVAWSALSVYAAWRTTRRAPVPPEEQGTFVPLVRTSQAALEMHPLAAEAGAEDEQAEPPSPGAAP